MLGYKTAEKEVTTATFYPITLEDDSKLVDEVVVVGYGAVKKKRPHRFGGVRQNGGARQPLLHFGRRTASGPCRRSSGAEHFAGSGCGSDRPHPRQQLARRLQHAARRSQRLPDGRCGQPLADQRLGHRVDRDSQGRLGIGNLRIAGRQRRDPRHDQVGRKGADQHFGQAPDGHQPALRPARHLVRPDAHGSGHQRGAGKRRTQPHLHRPDHRRHLLSLVA